MKTHAAKAGFTLAEMLFSVTIMVLTVAASIGGYLYVWQGGQVNTTQSNLDIDVRLAINQLRHDLRLSAMNKIITYPAGAGPYSAISFPMATVTNNGLLNYGTNGLIQWDKTVCYHVWSGQPSQLRITTFPYNNNLTDSQRQLQLSNVVVSGNGSGTFDGGQASTRMLFDNLVQWSIFPQNAIFDGYAASPQRALNVDMGSVILAPGNHTFAFTTTGKNAASSGYKVGLDTLIVSPCGVAREAEAQLPVTSQSGATAVSEYMAAGGWSGNYRLTFPATASNQSFTLTMENDRWEENNFTEGGNSTDQTLAQFDTNLWPYDFDVVLEGPGYAWTAAEQTGDAGSGGTSNDALRACAVRTLLRGSQEVGDGNHIKLDGSMNYVCFMAAPQASLRILAAYIAPCSDNQNYTPDAASVGVPLLFNGNSTSYDLGPGSSCWAWPSGTMAINRTNAYLVSYLVENGTHADARAWTEQHAGAPGSWLLPAALNPTTTNTAAANWSAQGAVQSSQLLGVYGMYTTCPTNGTYTSPIVDTQQSAPVYSDINWTSTLNGGTIAMRVRSGSQSDLSDAPAWTNITALTSPGAISPGNGRFVQFQAQLKPNSTTWNTPSLRNVVVRWGGVARAVEIGGTFSQGPDHGIWQLTVDGQPLIRGLTMNLTIYQDVSVFGGGSRRLTSTVSDEIYPRNTGK